MSTMTQQEAKEILQQAYQAYKDTLGLFDELVTFAKDTITINLNGNTSKIQEAINVSGLNSHFLIIPEKGKSEGRVSINIGLDKDPLNKIDIIKEIIPAAYTEIKDHPTTQNYLNIERNEKKDISDNKNQDKNNLSNTYFSSFHSNSLKDEDELLFGKKKSHPTNEKKTKENIQDKLHINLGFDDEDKLFTSKQEPASKANVTSNKKATKENLFNLDNLFDDDLFSDPSTSKQNDSAINNLNENNAPQAKQHEEEHIFSIESDNNGNNMPETKQNEHHEENEQYEELESLPEQQTLPIESDYQIAKKEIEEKIQKLENDILAEIDEWEDDGYQNDDSSKQVKIQNLKEQLQALEAQQTKDTHENANNINDEIKIVDHAEVVRSGLKKFTAFSLGKNKQLQFDNQEKLTKFIKASKALGVDLSKNKLSIANTVITISDNDYQALETKVTSIKSQHNQANAAPLILKNDTDLIKDTEISITVGNVWLVKCQSNEEKEQYISAANKLGIDLSKAKSTFGGKWLEISSEQAQQLQTAKNNPQPAQVDVKNIPQAQQDALSPLQNILNEMEFSKDNSNIVIDCARDKNVYEAIRQELQSYGITIKPDRVNYTITISRQNFNKLLEKEDFKPLRTKLYDNQEQAQQPDVATNEHRNPPFLQSYNDFYDDDDTDEDESDTDEYESDEYDIDDAEYDSDEEENIDSAKVGNHSLFQRDDSNNFEDSNTIANLKIIHDAYHMKSSIWQIQPDDSYIIQFNNQQDATKFVNAANALNINLSMPNNSFGVRINQTQLNDIIKLDVRAKPAPELTNQRNNQFYHDNNVNNPLNINNQIHNLQNQNNLVNPIQNNPANPAQNNLDNPPLVQPAPVNNNQVIQVNAPQQLIPPANAQETQQRKDIFDTWIRVDRTTEEARQPAYQVEAGWGVATWDNGQPNGNAKRVAIPGGGSFTYNAELHAVRITPNSMAVTQKPATFNAALDALNLQGGIIELKLGSNVSIDDAAIAFGAAIRNALVPTIPSDSHLTQAAILAQLDDEMIDAYTEAVGAADISQQEKTQLIQAAQRPQPVPEQNVANNAAHNPPPQGNPQNLREIEQANNRGPYQNRIPPHMGVFQSGQPQQEPPQDNAQNDNTLNNENNPHIPGPGQ